MKKNLKNKKNEYVNYCDSVENQKQILCIRNYIKDVIDKWVAIEDFSNRYPEYQMKGFYDLGIFASFNINYEIINNNQLVESETANSLWHELIDMSFDTYDTFDDDFAIEKLSYLSKEIIDAIEKFLPKEDRFILPINLRNIMDEYNLEEAKEKGYMYCDHYGVLHDFRKNKQ